MVVETILSGIYILVTVLIGVITAAVVYARWHYGTLERVKGLPAVIKPSFVGGSDIYVYKKIVQDADLEKVKKYGRIFGAYEGRAPHIYIADPEMIRLIFIKDFDHFHDKRVMDYGHELINEMLDLLPYDKWKAIRTTMSPTFTSGKIRHMSLTMSETIEDWMKAVKEKVGNKEAFEPRRMFDALTSDVIARCVFGTKLNSLHDPDSRFVKETQKLLSEGSSDTFLLTLAHTFPFLARLAPALLPGPLMYFRDLIKSVMKTRRESNIKVNDFVDCLNELMEKVEKDEEYKKLGITETSVMCQALIFFLAGFETTSSTLTFLTYNLAKHPDAQEKLVQEVDSYLERHDGKIEHETLGELQYLSACINETLRMFPPVIRTERVCNKEWFHEPTGLLVPKDMVIQVPIYAVHYDPEYYPEPDSFKPERFLPENKDKLNPYAFLSFGLGPHNCIGMRFAKEELHIAAANVMKNFTFKATPETKIEFRPGRTFIFSLKHFSVEALRRHEE